MLTTKSYLDLFTNDELNQLRENHRNCNKKGHDPFPVVSLRIFYNRCRWLLTEVRSDGIAFGLCDMGVGSPELGYVDLNEVYQTTGKLLYVDRKFKAIAPLSVYAEAARKAQEITEEIEFDASITETATEEDSTIPLQQFLSDYRDELLEQVNEQTPVFYNGEHETWQDDCLAQLKRQPFEAQKSRIHACYSGLVTHGLPAVFLNGEMGTGKTFMGISVSALIHKGHSQKPTLVISPPHLVYKWRREILDTIPDAAVTVINGSNAMQELMRFRDNLVAGKFSDGRPRYLIIGRVRMRMGFYWRPAYWKRRYSLETTDADNQPAMLTYDAVACPHCGRYQFNTEGEVLRAYDLWGAEQRKTCQHCREPLWTMKHRDSDDQSEEDKLRKFLLQLPGIGKKSCDKLIATFGVKTLSQIIDDNLYDFVNLMDAEGKFVFKEKHAQRLEKAMGRLEFAMQMISYQPSEFVKRYFPRKAFSLALIDEAHEYKNAGSAQGQAMAVLCSEAEKVLCLTGTLMGGYASDLFHLLFRAMPTEMVKMGYKPNSKGSFASAESRFMETYGCLIQTFKYRSDGSFATSNAKRTSVSTKKAPGFSPQGIAQFVLPYAVFMRLIDLGEGILPDYIEQARMIDMDDRLSEHYQQVKSDMRSVLDHAVRTRNIGLMSTAISVLMRRPETAHIAEEVLHPQEKTPLATYPAIYAPDEPTAKEQDIIDVCREEKAQRRKVIVYTTYTERFDTATRLKTLLTEAGLKAAVLRSTVSSDAREDWISDQVEKGIDVLITNPELVKTGLDLLSFPTIYFAQTGYNVYTVAQAARRSWRIGQKETVKVYYACYSESSQKDCYELMAKKMKTALSTMGVMPETGLDSFDEEEDETSITSALAKQLLNRR
ncbi:DUF2958 domain-containing protein [Suttonella ornithocola]|uniref:Protein of uncharacterized function (DUF2958) n=1 Tax=Suttonella ornithocola TaxID=279832 RepID=A0A380MW04_9GAMM|nr:DUF2958 domain-containing protein [Suttonella ornithocola]SUO96749.1 Protein of uncharacterised function (DUF2958) [Suttonella ornithocola]